jgi:hypothetical protein
MALELRTTLQNGLSSKKLNFSRTRKNPETDQKKITDKLRLTSNKNG